MCSRSHLHITAAIAARIAAQYAPTPNKAKHTDGPKYEKDKRKHHVHHC